MNFLQKSLPAAAIVATLAASDMSEGSSVQGLSFESAAQVTSVLAQTDTDSDMSWGMIGLEVASSIAMGLAIYAMTQRRK